MSDKKFTNYSLYCNFLNALAKDLTRYYYKKLNKPFKVINKSRSKGFDPVTKADRAFEKFIRFKIKKKFPTHDVIGEEFGHTKTKSDFTWVIDPIDGTRSFIIGSPTWSNLISVSYNNEPFIGLVNFPMLKKYYISGINNNSYLVENNKFKKLKVVKSKSFNNSKIAGNFFGWLTPNEQKKISKLTKLMRYPCSDALSYCQLCEGKLNVVLQCFNKIWDIHPMISLIKNAGGYISTWKGKNPKMGGSILASSNIDLHKKILKMLKPVA